MTVRPHELRLYNTLSRAVETFVPRVAGRVGIYVCGPTVYGAAHLGHAKSYVSFDVIVRYLRWLGYEVKYIQNITDVGHLVDNAEEGEDKIERLAKVTHVHPLEIAQQYTDSYFADMRGLGVRDANLYPRATQHIPEQIEMIETLIKQGHAYAVDGNVYFSVTSWPEYGALSGRQNDDQLEGTRVQARSDKRDPRDFALWKRAEGGHIQHWNSPWGVGYPGWHIECSAMSMKYLGEEFDIHGGGLENQFPHHECEIAQSRAATGKGFARYWMHNNMINRDGQKMSKSLNNGINCADLLKAYTAPVIRVFLLSTHYRAPANYTDEAINAGKTGLARLHATWTAARNRAQAEGSASVGDAAINEAVAEFRAHFQKAMDDDFNTPLAIASAFDFARRVNAALAAGAPAASQAAWKAVVATFDELTGDVLGLAPTADVGASAGGDLGPVMAVVLDVRRALRERRLFDLTDLVRDRLDAIGIDVKDTKDGATWARRS